MQSLEIISVQIVNILISLCNLVVLFLILKKFLYEPVRKMLAARQAAVDTQYAEAESARDDALALKDKWQNKMDAAESQAEVIVKKAVESANRQSAAIIDESREQAGRIVRQAKNDAALERSRVEAEIREQIADVSVALSEKMLGREINGEDHRVLIDAFLDELE
ncbi:MAG: F0F1 ATP synthase subunit B [Clostridia bacterium]|jgi:F-type H+-transporting ATPase subunit b|nr:F0F1 ATP synthase subunit B [Clostridia bacterium]MBQ5545388.1 F0F1 ATP synthase subunit B [Clostridia bacterium]